MPFDPASYVNGLLGALTGWTVAWFFLRRWVERRDKRQDRTDQRLEKLEDQDLDTIKADHKELRRAFEDCKTRCIGPVVQAKIDIVIAQNNDILRDIKKFDRETATQGQKLNETADHLMRLHAAFDDHRDKAHAHQ